MNTKKVLAVDLGASSGRVMLGTYDGERIAIEELHRFPNDPVMIGGTLYWDFLRLFHEIKQGLLMSKKYGKIDSIAVDTWGVDFGLIDERGYLLENPVHYRDARTTGMVDRSFEKIDRERFYQITGNQFMEINTAFQLLSLIEDRGQLLDRADRLLLMPDLFNYYLSGECASEYSIASTTQLLDAHGKCWSQEVIKALGIPTRLLSDIVPSGTRLGPMKSEICEELGIEPIDVIAIAGHDTQSAMVAVPTEGDDFIFVSCGTWSLFGTELDSPIIDENSQMLNITNEGGYGGKISFLKNIIGLWLVQESRRQWMREGKEYSFGHLEQMARSAEPFYCLIDPDAPEFVAPGDVPGRIQKYCKALGQQVPLRESQIVRCINESLALKYRKTLDEIRQCTGGTYQTIHIVGGGTQSELLCQMTANACGCKVVAGPIEATVLGNIAIQLLATGDIKNLKEARRIIAASADVKVYEPEDSLAWDEAYRKYRELFG